MVQAGGGGRPPPARLRLAQMENPDLMDKPSAEPARTLLNDCLAKAAAGDFITLKGISEYVTPEQWEQLTATLRKKARGERPQPGGSGIPDVIQLQERRIRLPGSPGLGPAFRPDREIPAACTCSAAPSFMNSAWKNAWPRGFLDVPGSLERPCGCGGHVEFQQ